MNREASSPSSPRPCNKPAQSSLVISLISFIPGVFVVAFSAFLSFSSWGIRSSNPNHPWEPIISFLGGFLMLGILWFPISFIGGLIAILRGAQGRRAACGLPGNIGQTKSMIGIVLGLLVLLLPFVYFLIVAGSGAFRS
jgi:hypothetical protein